VRTIRLDPNETLDPYASNRPTNLFTGFLETLDREASGGQLPYEVIGDPSKVGGASVRLVVSRADRRFRYRQRVMEHRFLAPAWVYVIGSAIAAGELPAVPGWNKSKWTAPRKFSVDAGRESRESRADVESGLVLWSDDIAQRGGDFDEWLAARTEQATKISQAAEKAGVPLWMIYNPSHQATNEPTSPAQP
jgi:capsid protein